ncbi:MAG: DegT/DnrJ/EryC1/StrS family aminotransferase [Thermoclostridium sp.]|nr:DegT/DnrJ/EryC1/StrS family aminotransferase [Thermoclostridium sp.]
MKIPLSKASITQQDIDAVSQVLSSGQLSIGPQLVEFEKSIADYTGVKHAIGVNSGTSGLHCLIRAMEIQKGDEVITTPFSFIASTNCFLFEGAKPVFADIDEKTYNINLEQVEGRITSNTKLLLPVDVFGQPLDMRAIMNIAQNHQLKVLEDSCEAIGSEYDGIKAGSAADGAVFAFYPNKQMTTAEGGMIVTNDHHLADTCRSLRNQGRSKTSKWLEHDQLGYNYRMSELHAALGLSQFNRFETLLEKRNTVAQSYNKRLKNIDGIRIPYIHPKVNKMSWFVYTVAFAPGIDRDKVMDLLGERGIDSKPYFSPIHLQAFMRKAFGFQEGDFPVTERIAKSTLSLPFYTDMQPFEVDAVCDALIEIIGKF